MIQHSREASEISGQEAYVVARVAQGPLRGPQKTAQELNPAASEERVEIEQKRREDAKILEVVPLRQGVEQSAGLARPERNRERIYRPDDSRRLACG